MLTKILLLIQALAKNIKSTKDKTAIIFLFIICLGVTSGFIILSLNEAGII